MRRKLLLEKFLDGETQLAADNAFSKAIWAATNSERIVFSQQVLTDSIGALGSKNVGDYIRTMLPPYNSVWIETEHHNRAWAVFRGSYEEVIDFYGTTDEVIGLGNTHPSVLEDMLAIFVFLQVHGQQDAYQIMPAMMLQSLNVNPDTGAPTRLLIGAKDGHLKLEPDEIDLFRSACLIPMYGFLALNVQGASSSSTISADAAVNKKRVKRGKEELRNYTYVTSKMSETGECISNDSTCSRSAHLVRGHFKSRKTGVFWWKPHIAGSGELKKRDAYIVKP